jgi:hypothetical protein
MTFQLDRIDGFNYNTMYRMNTKGEGFSSTQLLNHRFSDYYDPIHAINNGVDMLFII